MSPEEAAVYATTAGIADEVEAAREDELRRWAAELLSLLTEPAHWQILKLARAPGFRLDNRRLARETGASIDAINIVLSRLLRLGLIETDKTGVWRDLTGLKDITPSAFRKFAVTRLSKLVAK